MSINDPDGWFILDEPDPNMQEELRHRDELRLWIRDTAPDGIDQIWLDQLLNRI